MGGNSVPSNSFQMEAIGRLPQVWDILPTQAYSNVRNTYVYVSWSNVKLLTLYGVCSIHSA